MFLQNLGQDQNEIWSDIDATYDKHFHLVSTSIVKTETIFRLKPFLSFS